MTSSKEYDGQQSNLATDLIRIGVPLVVVLLLAAAWQFTPLGELAPEMREAISSIRGMPAAPVIVVAAFIIGGLVVAPVSILMLATVVAFGPIRGGFYAMAGVLASGSVMFLVGRVVGRRSLERVLGPRMTKVESILSNHGVVTVAVARNIPVAPYSVVNLIAGASPLRLNDYFFGTLLGFLPAIVALAVVGDRIARFAENPDQGSLLMLIGLVAALATGGVVAGRWLLRRTSQ